MSAPPTFSIIIIPGRQCDEPDSGADQAHALALALDSLLAQSNPDWEALVISEGATASAAACMADYAHRDPRIQIFQPQQADRHATYNESLHQAQGQWLCWLTLPSTFDRHTLEILQKSIQQEPQTFFFHTPFAWRDDEGRLIETIPVPSAFPTRAWQIIQLLQFPYLHSSSVWIARAAIERVGGFRDHLHHAQEYDLWLRLLAQYTATLIPECTTTAKWQRGQTGQTLFAADTFDASRATIDFLNQHPFEALFPQVNLAEPQNAKVAVDQALSAAATFDAPLLYGLGPHPGLLWKIVEWLLRNRHKHHIRAIQAVATEKIDTLLKRKNLDPAFRLQWKAAYTALRLPTGAFEVPPLAPDAIATQHYWQLAARHAENHQALRDYLISYGHAPESLSPPDKSTDKTPDKPLDEVTIVCQMYARVDGQIKYGAARAWMAIADYLQQLGAPVLLIGISQDRLGVTENVPFLGIQEEAELPKVLRLLAPHGTLIAISRIDIFPMTTANRAIIYHHGPHPPLGEYARQLVRRLKLPIVVVSRDSMAYQLQHGVPKEQLHVVYNGYDAQTFKVNEGITRHRHRLIFAGRCTSEKGIDLAVRAFQLLRATYADAEFHIFGGNGFWGDDFPQVWPQHWLDGAGYPNWQRIEQELPGVKYCGEATPAQLAKALQEASLLVMPSRLHETFGLVSVEAQACGTIPVLPRRGGFPETLQEGITGYLVADNTVEALAAKIDDLWKHELPSAEQRQTAAAWVQQEFSWRKTGEEFVHVLESIPPQHHRLPALETLFWKELAHWTASARTTYSQTKSPLLRRTLKNAIRLVRHLSRRISLHKEKR